MVMAMGVALTTIDEPLLQAGRDLVAAHGWWAAVGRTSLALPLKSWAGRSSGGSSSGQQQWMGHCPHTCHQVGDVGCHAAAADVHVDLQQ